MRRFIKSALAAGALTVMAVAVGPAVAVPNNQQTLHFELTCDDGNVYQATLSEGSASFHLDTGGRYTWKQIWFETPAGESGSLTRGSGGFDIDALVTCTYIGADSGNDYTVVGFYP